MWGEPKTQKEAFSNDRFQLTRPVWGEPRRLLVNRLSLPISTHSPRVGRTRQAAIILITPRNFNSLAPCGANPVCRLLTARSTTFQLTRPVWGEPLVVRVKNALDRISTHSPRVGRTVARRWARQRRRNFNSLAPCGANLSNGAAPTSSLLFQLTRPVWGEPRLQAIRATRCRISTHSPRVGRTLLPLSRFQIFDNFNSLAPCGANRMRLSEKQDKHQFQLTRPVWGEPSHCSGIGSTPKFQLTRPVWGEPS